MTQLVLIPVDLFEPIDTSTQVARIPGVDAPCHCHQETCGWPWCKPSEGDAG